MWMFISEVKKTPLKTLGPNFFPITNIEIYEVHFRGKEYIDGYLDEFNFKENKR